MDTVMLISKIIRTALVWWMSGCLWSSWADALPISDFDKRAQELLQPWNTSTEPGVAVAVSIDRKLVLTEGVGLANLEHLIPISSASLFQVASVSKQFTAFATLLLVSEGKIDLDDDVRNFLPELFATEPIITVRHLLDHTSGLREINSLAEMAGWLSDDVHTAQQMLELVARQRDVNFPAGSQVEYSNTGYALLAEIVARVSEQSFANFTRTHIFDPLGMTSTYFRADRNNLLPARASSYYPQGGGFKNVIASNELVGSTGLYSSAPDLLAWADNFRSRKVGNKLVFKLMAERAMALNGDNATFGRGQELKTYHGLQTWSHGGRDAGYRSFLLRAPDVGFAVAIVSNRTDFDTAKLAYALADIYLEDTAGFDSQTSTPWEAAPVRELVSYAGHYEYFPGLILTVSNTPEGLKLSNFGQSTIDLPTLKQIGTRRFLVNPQSDISIDFALPQDNLAPLFAYTIGLHGSLEFKRLTLQPFDAATVDVCEYTGSYESTELATRYQITCQGGKLFAKHKRHQAFLLMPYQADTFMSQSGPLKQILFDRSSAGELTGMKASGPFAHGVSFRRINPPPAH